MFVAKCHCGDVRLVARTEPESLTRCNCSICHRLGALWAYYAASDVQIEAAAGALEIYRWAEETMIFHRCRRCGCTTHYTAREADGDLVALNGRMAELEAIGDIPLRDFDGRDSWRYLDE